VDRRTKHYSQTSHLARLHQSFCLYANTRMDARGVTIELKLILKFYCSWTWCVFLIVFFPLFCFFVVLVWVFNFYSYFLFFFAYYHLYHHHLLIPTLTPFTLPPSVLKFIALIPILSAPSHPLSPTTLTLPSHSSPTCHQMTTPSYTLTTCWLIYYTNLKT
jgi:hypothetical protein